MLFLGIDPGQKGGIAALYVNDEDTNNREIAVDPMPLKKGKGKTAKEIDGLALWRLINTYVAKDSLTKTALELVHSMKAQGVRSTFTFGEGYGKVQGVLECMSINYVKVSPQK